MYDTIDYDQTGEVDFKKFCLMNVDKGKDVFDRIKLVQSSNVNTENYVKK